MKLTSENIEILNNKDELHAHTVLNEVLDFALQSYHFKSIDNVTRCLEKPDSFLFSIFFFFCEDYCFEK